MSFVYCSLYSCCCSFADSGLVVVVVRSGMMRRYYCCHRPTYWRIAVAADKIPGQPPSNWHPVVVVLATENNNWKHCRRRCHFPFLLFHRYRRHNILFLLHHDAIAAVGTGDAKRVHHRPVLMHTDDDDRQDEVGSNAEVVGADRGRQQDVGASSSFGGDDAELPRRAVVVPRTYCIRLDLVESRDRRPLRPGSDRLPFWSRRGLLVRNCLSGDLKRPPTSLVDLHLLVPVVLHLPADAGRKDLRHSHPHHC